MPLVKAQSNAKIQALQLPGRLGLHILRMYVFQFGALWTKDSILNPRRTGISAVHVPTGVNLDPACHRGCAEESDASGQADAYPSSLSVPDKLEARYSMDQEASRDTYAFRDKMYSVRTI